MKIVLATPLYPPDIAEPAPYVKELAKRLKLHHEVTIVAYGHLPEKVPGVKIVAVPKNRMLPLRLIDYTFKLLQAARGADIIYAQNGASVELPAALITLAICRPLIMGLGDASAHSRAAHKRVLGLIERFALGRAKAVVPIIPPERPEILPFEPKPEAALHAYEKSWGEHVRQLEELYARAKHHD
jgi:hypothetical protein